MNEYVKQAKDFLASCDAKMDIMYLGLEMNESWYDTRERDAYMVNIRTPKGSMQVKFWDSFANTDRNRWKAPRIKPSEYSVLACLQKYDVGSLEDFMWEYGYEIKQRGDLKRIQDIYNAVVKEYQDICRCFTPEQIEAMQEIQ